MTSRYIVGRFLSSELSKSFQLKAIDKLLLFFIASAIDNLDDKNPFFPKDSDLFMGLDIDDKNALHNSYDKLIEKNILVFNEMDGIEGVSLNVNISPLWEAILIQDIYNLENKINNMKKNK